MVVMDNHAHKMKAESDFVKETLNKENGESMV